MYETLKHDPLFENGLVTPTLDEQRDLTYRRWRRIQEYQFIDPYDVRIFYSCLFVNSSKKQSCIHNFRWGSNLSRWGRFSLLMIARWQRRTS